MVVRWTTEAHRRLLAILQTSSRKVVLFSVQGGGLNGLTYRLAPHNGAKEQFDEDLSLGKEGTLRVCGHSLLYLLGTTIDWKRDVMGETFHFTNPNTTSTCGCGATFSPNVQ
jgi:iron-sulfur cluster assembly accessory protein